MSVTLVPDLETSPNSTTQELLNAVDGWFDRQTPVEFIGVRRADGVRVAFCVNREALRAARARGDVAFNPHALKQFILLEREAGEAGKALVEALMRANTVMPGIGLTEVWKDGEQL